MRSKLGEFSAYPNPYDPDIPPEWAEPGMNYREWLIGQVLPVCLASTAAEREQYIAGLADRTIGGAIPAAAAIQIVDTVLSMMREEPEQPPLLTTAEQ